MVGTHHATALRNHVLASLPPRDMEVLRTYLVRVPLVRDQLLVDYNQPIDHVFFIEQGIVSILSEPMNDDCGVEVAMIGRDGFVGDLAIAEVPRAACSRAVVRIQGTAYRIAGTELRRLMDRSSTLRTACGDFAHSVTAQVMQTAACNARQSLAERCARWLMMALERVDGSELRVTHEVLSTTLGIGRTGVTVAAAALQQKGLIQTGRGRITVLDKEGLRGIALGTRSFTQAGVPRPEADGMSRYELGRMGVPIAV